MLGSLRRALSAAAGHMNFRSLPAHKTDVVFYSEDAASWCHLRPLVDELTQTHGCPVCCVTSDANDPVLAEQSDHLSSVFIGSGLIRNIFFAGLKAKLLVMTMPDLENFQIKRSQAADVHYVYVFHSIVSTHMIYRHAAFDHFDTIMCSGPHHGKEVRATEKLYDLKEKNLVEYGYPVLDNMLKTHMPATGDDSKREPHVMVAPSWGPHGLLETNGVAAVEALLDAGLRTTVRPHPMTARKSPDAIKALTQRFAQHPLFGFDTNVGSQDSLFAADLLISDWSGVALEYAFGTERPVLFVDVPRKVNNEAYQDVGLEPLEVSVRSTIGNVVSPDDLTRLGDVARELLASVDVFRDRIVACRDATIYNIGRSASVGAGHILTLR